MLLDYTTYAAYICPYCGKVNERTLSIFDIPKNGLSLVCTNKWCGAGIAVIKPSGDKYAVETECTACGSRHQMKFRKDKFWRKKQLTVTCPETMMDIMFFGGQNDIKKALKEQEQLLHDAETEIYSDPELGLYFGIISAVNDIAKKNKVTCSVCGSHKADVSLTDDGILIECRDCGACKLYGINTEALEELLKTGTIVLG